MRQQPTRVDRRKGGRCMPSSEAGPQHPFYLITKKESARSIIIIGGGSVTPRVHSQLTYPCIGPA